MCLSLKNFSAFFFNQLNQLTAGASVDNAFNQVFSPDPWGNLKQSGTAAFTPNFDGNNRISQTGYDYVAAGNRVRKDVSGNDPTEYIYFNGEPIAEHDLNTGWPAV